MNTEVRALLPLDSLRRAPRGAGPNLGIPLRLQSPGQWGCPLRRLPVEDLLCLLPAQTQVSGPALTMPGKARAQPRQDKAERPAPSQERRCPWAGLSEPPRRKWCFSQFPELILTSGHLHLCFLCQEGSSQVLNVCSSAPSFPVHGHTLKQTPYPLTADPWLYKPLPFFQTLHRHLGLYHCWLAYLFVGCP